MGLHNRSRDFESAANHSTPIRARGGSRRISERTPHRPRQENHGQSGLIGSHHTKRLPELCPELIVILIDVEPIFNDEASSLSSRAVFLDRDGVLTRERPDYVKTPDELEIFPSIYEPLRELRQSGFRIVLITNQSVVGRGFATEAGLHRIHQKLTDDLAKHGCFLDRIYYCPHRPEEGCDCRKPNPGMILAAARDLRLDVAKCWMVGDKDIDMEAANRAGCKRIKVSTNSNELARAVEEILSTDKSVGELNA
jgi:D-glycero-D-manno-heptose 1,7-bisphosphate phosphatase